VLLAENEDEMRSMIERLEEYMDKKRLEVNVEKTKIMRFRKGTGRLGTRDWRWKGKKLEEMGEFRYLGYMLQRNGGQEAQVRERIKKAAAVLGLGYREKKVWKGLGEEIMAVRQISVDSTRIWGRDMEMERKRGG